MRHASCIRLGTVARASGDVHAGGAEALRDLAAEDQPRTSGAARCDHCCKYLAASRYACDEVAEGDSFAEKDGLKNRIRTHPTDQVGCVNAVSPRKLTRQSGLVIYKLRIAKESHGHVLCIGRKERVSSSRPSG